jgi:hypothetical protein
VHYCTTGVPGTRRPTEYAARLPVVMWPQTPPLAQYRRLPLRPRQRPPLPSADLPKHGRCCTPATTGPGLPQPRVCLGVHCHATPSQHDIGTLCGGDTDIRDSECLPNRPQSGPAPPAAPWPVATTSLRASLVLVEWQPLQPTGRKDVVGRGGCTEVDKVPPAPLSQQQPLPLLPSSRKQSLVTNGDGLGPAATSAPTSFHTWTLGTALQTLALQLMARS